MKKFSILIALFVALSFGLPAVVSFAATPKDGKSSIAKIEKIKLNSATKAQLETIPGIGPQKADRIIQLRKKKGNFAKMQELLEIKGIGEKTLARISPYLTL